MAGLEKVFVGLRAGARTFPGSICLGAGRPPHLLGAGMNATLVAHRVRSYKAWPAQPGSEG